MTFSVHQHWNPLKVCAVGRSYPPEFYNFIKNQKTQSMMKRIAEETEEDYQKLIKLLHGFGVDVVRTTINEDFDSYLSPNGNYVPPPMCPGVDTVMIGNKFFMPTPDIRYTWDDIRGADWPKHPHGDLPDWIITELREIHGIDPSDNNLSRYVDYRGLKSIEELVKKQGNEIIHEFEIDSSMITKIGIDLYHQTSNHNDQEFLDNVQKFLPEYRNHAVKEKPLGHCDQVFCPVKPGLIISLRDTSTYSETFPDWEVIHLPGESWYLIEPVMHLRLYNSTKPSMALKQKNHEKWWIPGEELNDEFTNFVESWLGHWVGYIEDSVFDVSMLVIDDKNVICNNENDLVFEAFARHGITPHVCNFRHRYFWDSGLHSITSDLHREGTQEDYFPNRS